jgi:hypothetical protein
MVTVAMNRLGKEMDGYLFASSATAKDDPTGAFRPGTRHPAR